MTIGYLISQRIGRIYSINWQTILKKAIQKEIEIIRKFQMGSKENHIKEVASNHEYRDWV